MIFDDVRVPQENLVVGPGGFRQLFSIFSIERLGNATMSLAIAQAALDRTVAYVQERRQFGKPLIEFQAVQMTLADMVLEVEAARQLLLRAAGNAGTGLPDPFEVSVAKTTANEMAKRVTDLAMQLHGGNGYTEEYGIERLHRDAHGWAIAGGRPRCSASGSCPSCSAAPSTSGGDGRRSWAGSESTTSRTCARFASTTRVATSCCPCRPNASSSSRARRAGPVALSMSFLYAARCRCCVLADRDAYPRACARDRGRPTGDDRRLVGKDLAAGGRRMLAIRGVAEVHDDRETKDWFLPRFADKLKAAKPEEFMRLLDSDNASSSRFVPWPSPRATTPARCPAMGGEAPVAKHLMVVLSNAKPGQEDEFNRWYSQVHVLDTINKLDGFLSAQRFEQPTLPEAPPCPYRYLAIYEIEEDQLDTAYAQFRWQRQERAEALAAGRDPVVPVSDTLDPSAFIVGFFSPHRAHSVGTR